MAGSVNKVILVGNLGRDPEIRSTQDGTRIANLAVATSESWRDKMSGERKERTEWHRVVIFNDRLAEVAEKYLKKGAKVYVEGACRPANGPTTAARSATRPKSCCRSGFRGELTMLDGARGAGGGAPIDRRLRRGGFGDERARLGATAPAAAAARRSTTSTTTSRSDQNRCLRSQVSTSSYPR